MLRRWSLLASLSIAAACSLEDPEAGKGLIVLSPGTKAHLEEYMGRNAPLYFAVTENGGGSYSVYCDGGFNCDGVEARRRALDGCRAGNAGRDCKIYAIRRVVVWQDPDARSARTGPQLSAGERLIRDCLEGATPVIRIDRCSQAIASSELADEQKRGPFYVRARAYEQTGELRLAEQDYRAVLEIDPDHAEARARLDRLLAPSAAEPHGIRPQTVVRFTAKHQPG
jgi:hypothetical protein